MSVAYPCIGACRQTGVICTGCTVGAHAVLDQTRQRVRQLELHIAYLERRLEDHGIEFSDTLSHIGAAR